jgi:hypothetical protein
MRGRERVTGVWEGVRQGGSPSNPKRGEERVFVRSKRRVDGSRARGTGA